MSKTRRTGIISLVDSKFQNWFLDADSGEKMVWIGLGGGPAFRTGTIPEQMIRDGDWMQMDKFLLGKRVNYTTYEDENGEHATDVYII